MARHRLLLCALAAAAGWSPAAAQPAGDAKAFEAALAASQPAEAGKLLSAMIARRRPADGPASPDPLLNGLIGRLLLVRGHPTGARSYLERSIAPEVPASLRIEAALALATARELSGDRKAAAEALQGLASEPLTPRQRSAARLHLARLAMVEDPRAAIAELRALAAGAAEPAERWEAELALAQALALAGDVAAARAAADQAWASAARAPARHMAPLRTALQRAALAAGAGDRDSLIAMLNVSGASAQSLSSTVSDMLPVCGEAGLGERDQVTFGAHNGPGAPYALAPLAASRPEAVAPFYDALAGQALLGRSRKPGGGLTFTVRCRSSLSASIPARPPRTDPRSDWMVSRGLYGPVHHNSESDEINRLAAEIERVERRHGERHAPLIPLRLKLIEWLEARAEEEGDVEEWQVRQQEAKVRAAMRAIGGVEELVPPDGFEEKVRAMAGAAAPEEGLAQYRSLAMEMVRIAPFDEAYEGALEWFGRDKDLPAEMQKEAVETLLKRVPPDQARQRAALLIRLARIQGKAGDHESARAAYRSQGIADDLCIAMDEPPRLDQQDITDHDYPQEAIQGFLEGLSVLEYSVTAAGKVADPRIILSSPSIIFDPVVEAELGAFRLSPPLRDGRARACRGAVQRIQWKLPDEADDFPMPRFVEPSGTAT